MQGAHWVDADTGMVHARGYSSNAAMYPGDKLLHGEETHVCVTLAIPVFKNVTKHKEREQVIWFNRHDARKLSRGANQADRKRLALVFERARPVPRAK